MSDDIAIKVEGLGKKYILRHQKSRGRSNYVALRDVLTEKITAPFRNFGRKQKGAEWEEFWAVRDLSFEIKKGEAVGIIGRNGAGKSTLLKLLSRITHPTTGRIELNGRIASLLEVGTGFHPELTGRENIYLNGAILGMRRAEIKRKFDEIVAFAEVERFLDTPVKRYSSGMYVRLAFAVAAHLEPEILVVDEVLAVGDAEFQKKCLGKMGEVAKAGRTVLFVSHNMAAIEALTEKGVLLKSGRMAFHGSAREAVSLYFDQAGQQTVTDLASVPYRDGNGDVRFVSLQMRNECGEESTIFRPGEEMTISFTMDVKVHTTLEIGCAIENQKEQALFTTHLSDKSPAGARKYEPGLHKFEFKISPNHLRRGSYLFSLAASTLDKLTYYDILYHHPAFEIDGEGIRFVSPADDRWGDLYFEIPWTHSR